MGFLRGALVFVLGVVLLGVLIAGNMFLTLGLSTSYDVVKPELNNLFYDVIKDESSIQESVALMEVYCAQNNTEFTFKDDVTLEVFVIPCENIENGVDSVVNYSVGYLVDKVYYEDYDCDFWNCIDEAGTPAFLVSKKANDYWFSKYYLFLGFALILMIAMFLITENRTGVFLVFGVLSISSSLLFIKLDAIANFILNFAMGDLSFAENVGASVFMGIFSVFFTKSYSVFLWMFCVGILFVLIWILLKFFKLGIVLTQFFAKINEKRFSKKEVEKIVDKKVSKSKQK